MVSHAEFDEFSAERPLHASVPPSRPSSHSPDAPTLALRSTWLAIPAPPHSFLLVPFLPRLGTRLSTRFELFTDIP
ncbi:hypothetical protein PsorP6_013873 [Peronosclerospora sorghi]|uniref:Uncharacterized protein n=1 Tax=Peronosclerospora sorghi TaxID=230839 RepID=A0ACC0VHC1_9STRA|nr:hypothetical protein PsorP6_013873 [Peronosclerospora sorghi]